MIDGLPPKTLEELPIPTSRSRIVEFQHVGINIEKCVDVSADGMSVMIPLLCEVGSAHYLLGGRFERVIWDLPSM
jgi:hypothetical protein